MRSPVVFYTFLFVTVNITMYFIYNNRVVSAINTSIFSLAYIYYHVVVTVPAGHVAFAIDNNHIVHSMMQGTYMIFPLFRRLFRLQSRSREVTVFSNTDTRDAEIYLPSILYENEAEGISLRGVFVHIRYSIIDPQKFATSLQNEEWLASAVVQNMHATGFLKDYFLKHHRQHSHSSASHFVCLQSDDRLFTSQTKAEKDLIPVFKENTVYIESVFGIRVASAQVEFYIDSNHSVDSRLDASKKPSVKKMLHY